MPHRRKHVPPKRVTQPPEPVTRQGRISKTKAKDTIKSVTTTPHRPRVMASPRSHSVSSSSNGTATSQPELSRLGALEKGFEMMLEIHQANKVTLDQLVERLDGIGGVSLTPPVPTVTGIPSILPVTSSSSPIQNVLSRWSWVDTATVESIANGQFDLNSLPKLHRQQTLRNRHVKATAEGLHIPLDRSKPAEVIIGTTKMHLAFNNFPTFVSAWQVYVSIRTSYYPERGPGLAMWLERIVHYVHLNYPWTVILDYIIDYFGVHQNSPPDIWYIPDQELVSNHLAISQQKPANTSANPSPSATKGKGKSSGPPVSQQICNNWNRIDVGCKNTDCPRRHVCSICGRDGHRAFQCPLSTPSTSK